MPVHTLTFQTIAGIIFIIKELFMHYTRISGPAALITVTVGALGTLLGICLLFIKPRREYMIALTVLAILPFLIGLGGTIAWGNEMRETITLEKKAGRTPSAEKYYDLEYAYSKFLISWFPALVGAASSIPPVIFVIILKRKITYGIISGEGGVG